MPAPDPLRAAWPGPSLHGPVVVVGNAPGVDAAAAIDAGGSVVRFNNAAGFGGRAGTRVTHLVLVNRGGQMREWLDDPGFRDRPVVRQAGCFVLPFPMLPEAHNRPEPICFTREALAMLRPLGRPVHILPEELHEAARADLGPLAAERPNPSTGFLTVLALLAGRPAGAEPVEAHGFGFAGWPGHPWAAERAWCLRAAAAGRLRLHPSPTDA
ncbi:hypothetical protein [Methylobacterium indicum]|uniref:hypothetical protein n=1 Tax=Methylobacterium indicum TaxID=1775910 RepID=UPI002435EE1B|nr:hypothetical protein [Methylobacterium indicum]